MNPLKIFNNVSLRTKFVVSISSLLIVTIIVFSTFLSKKQADGYRREIETSSETMVRMLSINLEYGVFFESKYEIDEALKILTQFQSVKYAEVTNSEGKLLSSNGEMIENYQRISPGHQYNQADGNQCEDYYIEDSHGNEYIELNYPVLSQNENLDRENLGMTGELDRTVLSQSVTEKIGSVKLFISLEMVNKSIAEARNTAILLTILASLLSIILLTLFIRVITNPIQMMVKATDKISRGEFNHRVNIKQNDEIGHLAETFNSMVDSLQQSQIEIENYNKTLEHKIIDRTKELKDTQEQLVQSEKLSAIGQLAAGVAHELNNPLGGILGYAQFALEKLKKNIPEQTTSNEMDSYIRYLGDIEKQARRCKNIVQNLLRFSRSSKATELIETNVNSLITDTCTFLEHQLSMNQINLVMNFDEQLPVIQGNPGQLQQVFTNIIINAMHASPDESKIEIVTRFSPPLGEFQGTVEILFIDQGLGISEENMKKIFEPFFTTKEVGKGTGLGLAVSYGIVKDHGGEIKVESELHKGTTFIIILPIQKVPYPTDSNNNNSYAHIIS